MGIYGRSDGERLRPVQSVVHHLKSTSDGDDGIHDIAFPLLELMREDLLHEAEYVDGIPSERLEIDPSRCDCAEPDEEIFRSDPFGRVILAMKRQRESHGDFGDVQTIIEDSRDSVEIIDFVAHGSRGGRFGVEETVDES